MSADMMAMMTMTAALVVMPMAAALHIRIIIQLAGQQSLHSFICITGYAAI